MEVTAAAITAIGSIVAALIQLYIVYLQRQPAPATVDAGPAAGPAEKPALEAEPAGRITAARVDRTADEVAHNVALREQDAGRQQAPVLQRRPASPPYAPLPHNLAGRTPFGRGLADRSIADSEENNRLPTRDAQASRSPGLPAGSLRRQDPPVGDSAARSSQTAEASRLPARRFTFGLDWYWWYFGLVIGIDVLIFGIVHQDATPFINSLCLVPTITVLLALSRPAHWTYVAAYVTGLHSLVMVGYLLGGGRIGHGDIKITAMLFTANAFVCAAIAWTRCRFVRREKLQPA